MIDIDALKRDKRPQSAWVVHALIDRLEAAEKDVAIKEEVIDSLAAVVKRLDAQCDAAEAEAIEQARLNGMGSEREAALMAKLEASEKSDAESIAMYRKARDERDALRAKIERMERQEPVAWMLNCQTLGGDTGWILSWTQSGAGLCNRLQGEENEKRLYALPGAQTQGEGK